MIQRANISGGRATLPHRRTGRQIGRAALPGLAALFLSWSAGAQLTTNDLPALAPPAPPIPPTFWERYEVVIITGGFAFLFLGLLVIRNLLRPAAPVVIPPVETASAALKVLAGRPEDGRLLSEVARTLRRYLVAAFALPPDEVTTAEFCAQLASSHRVGGALSEKLSSFLRECDRRKFSPEPAGTTFQAVNQATELIALVEIRRKTVVSEVAAEIIGAGG
jgi:hypothetical protein